MPSAQQRRVYAQWLHELTAIPTAAGREQRVVAWVTDWVRRRRGLRLNRDRGGNLIITGSGRRPGKPIFVTAHLDHPAFVVRRVIDERRLELEFRGGVHDPYFEDARIEIHDRHDAVHPAAVLALDTAAKPFKRVTARLARSSRDIAPGDVARWAFIRRVPRESNGLLHAHACDDLAGVAAALATLDALRRRRWKGPVGVLLTRAEEIGFIGAIAACRARSVPRDARLICLENSRSFADSPIGAGPILRVGDRLSVFDPELTNRLSEIMTAYAQERPGFAWQRRLMPGGACEATAFASFGYSSTCVCLPLGNYHNMSEIDAVLAGRRPALVAPEFIAVDDYHRMIEMLAACITRLDSAKLPGLRKRMEDLHRARQKVLEEGD